MKNEKIILGIDPGTTICGYGLIEVTGLEIRVLALGVMDLRKIPDHYVRIRNIFDRTLGLIDAYHPDEFAVESPFYGKNVQSMLKLGRAQGAAIAAALHRDLPVFEYAPRKIKMSITGQGAASKEQVAAMLQHILRYKDGEKHLPDATDALAAALCHHYQLHRPSASGGYKSWSDFLRKNPGRKGT